MKISTMRCVVVLVLIVLALGACRGKEQATSEEATGTIAPAQPQPEATGTDALTQTVELGDGRSVSEGGALAEGSTTDTSAMPPSTPSATDTSAQTSKTPAPPASTTR